MTAAAAAALPIWVMLERFVFRRDDPKSFRGDSRTSATCTTCAGARFDVSFVLAEPPTPSRIYLSWPAGPKGDMACHLMAAHRDLVLLRLDSFVDRSKGLDYRHEYFIYIAAHPSSPPLLRPLPQCMKYHHLLEKEVTSPFHLQSVGLLCHGEDEFAVAHLSIRITRDDPELKAELWVLRTSRRSCSRDGVAAERWERKLLPIQYEKGSSEHHDLLYWVVDEVVPFNNSMCWVNYEAGVLVCDGIFGGGSPRVSYARFPVDRFAGNDPWGVNKAMEPYRSLCVTDGGSRLAFVGVTSHDDAELGPRARFTFTVRTLEMLEEDGTVLWQSIDEAVKVVITSAQLRDASNSMCLPDPMDPMVYPLLRTDVPNIVVPVLFDSKVGRMSLVAIDLSESEVLGSVVPYIKSWKQGLSTDDDDMAKAKPIFFVRFLPSEFPKFLNRNR